MTKVQAIVREQQLDAIVERLLLIGIRGLTLARAKGSGDGASHREVFRGSSYRVDYVAKILIEWYGPDDEADAVMRAIQQRGSDRRGRRRQHLRATRRRGGPHSHGRTRSRRGLTVSPKESRQAAKPPREGFFSDQSPLLEACCSVPPVLVPSRIATVDLGAASCRRGHRGRPSRPGLRSRPHRSRRIRPGHRDHQRHPHRRRARPGRHRACRQASSPGRSRPSRSRSSTCRAEGLRCRRTSRTRSRYRPRRPRRPRLRGRPCRPRLRGRPGRRRGHRAPRLRRQGIRSRTRPPSNRSCPCMP